MEQVEDRYNDHIQSDPSNGVLLCDICKAVAEEEAKEIPPAIQYCIHCQQNICDQCLRDHKKFKELQNHQLTQIGSPPLKDDELIEKCSVQYCELHEEEEVRLFCDDCKEVICMICSAQKHESHNCSDIEDVAENFRNQIKCDMERMSHYAEETAAKMCQIDTLQSNFQKHVDDIEKDIIQRGTELKELVDRDIRSLLDELASIKERVSEKNESKREESETHKMVIQSFQAFGRELSSNGSSAEICRAANDLHLRAEELHIEHTKHIQQKTSPPDINFEPSKADDLLKNENIVGNIRVTNMPTVQLIGKLSCLNSYKVTKLDSKIYVLCEKPISINVFDDEIPFQSQEKIQVDEVGEAGEIESCEVSRCLYVSDRRVHCIWKITTDDHQVTKWLTRVNEPFTLSVTGEGHVLVLRKGQPSYHLEISGSDAKLIRRLPLPVDIREPQQVIQKQNGEFIVSHLVYDPSSGGQCVISRLTSNGQTVICRTNTKDVRLSLELRRICHLALDSHDRIFVINDYDGRVVLLDSISLNLIKVLLTNEENGITSPYRLFYDDKKKQLIVLHLNDEADIYEIS